MNRLASVIAASVATVLAGTAVVTAASGAFAEDDDHDDDHGGRQSEQQVVLVDGQALIGTPVAGGDLQPGAASGVSPEEAGQIAARSYGGTVVNVASASEQGRPVWQVNLRGSSEGDIVVVIDSGSGEILKAERTVDQYASYDDDDDHDDDDDDDHDDDHDDDDDDDDHGHDDDDD